VANDWLLGLRHRRLADWLLRRGDKDHLEATVTIPIAAAALLFAPLWVPILIYSIVQREPKKRSA